MPCKNGTRKSLDTAKRYYEEQKKYDPWRELWTSLVKRAYTVDEGWKQFSTPERLYYAVSILDGEVYNGGMHHFSRIRPASFTARHLPVSAHWVLQMRPNC